MAGRIENRSRAVAAATEGDERNIFSFCGEEKVRETLYKVQVFALPATKMACKRITFYNMLLVFFGDWLFLSDRLSDV